MSRNSSISLEPHFEATIQKGIQSGRYASASEMIRAGFRIIDQEEIKVQKLKDAIAAGEQNGNVPDFDPERHLAELNTVVS